MSRQYFFAHSRFAQDQSGRLGGSYRSSHGVQLAHARAPLSYQVFPTLLNAAIPGTDGFFGNRRSPFERVLEGGPQFLVAQRFSKKIGSPALHSLDHVLGTGRTRQHDYRQILVSGSDFTQGLETVLLRHENVQQDGTHGPLGFQVVQHLVTVSGQFHRVTLIPKGHLQKTTNLRIVVSHHNRSVIFLESHHNCPPPCTACAPLWAPSSGLPNTARSTGRTNEITGPGAWFSAHIRPRCC